MVMMQEAVAFTPQLDASSIARWLWLIPALPMVAAGIISVLKQPRRRLASSLAIGSLGISLLIAITAFTHVLSGMMFAIFSIAVAAAEAAVGLGLVISIYRHAKTTDVEQMNRMKG